MAENTRTFQEILLEQRNTNKELASLKQENRLMSDVLKDIKEDAIKDSTNQGILRSALPEILADTGNTNRQLSEFDQQQETFGKIAGGIREMIGVSEDTNKLLKEAIKQDDEFYADQEAEEERAAAIKESKTDDDNKKEGNKLTKSLKDGITGIFSGFKGIFLGTAGIFAAIFAFVAALGNETFREIVFKATDAVTKAFVDFGELIEGDKGLLEFLRENALTLAGIITLLAPAKIFGLLFKAVKGLPKAVNTIGKNFSKVASFFRIFSPLLARAFFPIALISEAVSGITVTIRNAYDKFKETGNFLDAMNMGFASFIGYLANIPARIFRTLINGVLGLLEFISFGWLNFDTIQEKIKNLDFGEIVTNAIYNLLSSADDFIQNTLFNIPQFLADMKAKLINFTAELVDGIVNFAKNVGKKIYDPETGAILGMILPELPTLGDMFDKLKELKNKIYNPDTGAIFGFIPGEVFNFKLPNIGDLFMNLIGSILPDPNSFIGKGLYALPGTDILEQAAKAFSEGGEIVDGVMTMPNSTTSIDNTQLDAMEAKKQYEMLMRKMEENEKLTDEQKSFINQYNIMNGGNSVSQSSSTGFSTKKSAFNDDYSAQLLAGSMP